ncbi:MAG: hypothetical protein H6829_07325 [Planctomycetes bacterium]|nr:hypothetical protein [Planctomycetota bacterium]
MSIGVAGCRSKPPELLPSPSVEAQAAFRRARVALDRLESWEPVLQELEVARAAAPQWAAPQRLIDDLYVSLLDGPRVAREHWMALQAGPEAYLHAYWLGRLVPGLGGPGFDQAVALEPADPWGWHGRAFEARQAGQTQLAIEWQRTALELAREPYERNLFAGALARWYSERGAKEAGLRVLDQAEASCEEELDRVEVQLMWLDLARKVPNQAVQELCADRTRRLLADPELTTTQYRKLVEWGKLPAEEVANLLLGRPEREAQVLALRLLGEGGQALLTAFDPEAVFDTRPTLFAQGRPVQAVEDFLQALPSFLSSGMAPMERWTRLRNAAQHWQEAHDAASATELGDALLAVGWFEEAQAWVRSVPAGLSTEQALAFERCAARGVLTRTGLQELFTDLDRGQGRVVATEAGPGRRIQSLRDLLESVAQVLLRGRFVTPDEVEGLVESPRLTFGSFAEVVHPGPVSAPWDGAPPETPIPGLAAALLRMGRVGIFGAALGVPPDGTILPYIAQTFVEGEHLGVPFRGTVLWCGAADVGARAMRLGSQVAGAALHEGYYVDLDALQDTLARWDRLALRWDDAWQRERLRGALQDPGLPVELVEALRGPRDETSATFVPRGEAWLAAGPVLGEADRVRLALLLERGDGETLGSVELDEVAQMTATHEEGHLCERTRFLPLERHLLAVLGFLAAEGFDPAAIQARLEYRAELVALCEVPEPRLVLAEVLDLAQAAPSGLPHGPAYRELLGDLLVELAAGSREDAAWTEGWHPNPRYLLLHQLHRIPPSVLRGAARALAQKRGLTRGSLGQ